MLFNFDSIRDFLQCLKCGADLYRDQETLVCKNEACGQVYPIRDDIPQLLLNEEDESSD